MYRIEQLQDIVNKEIAHLDLRANPRELYEPVEYVLAVGGKRIRPVLTLMSCNLFSENIETAIRPAIGLEMFHNFTLLHDDIMDNADLRRNRPTVHIKWDRNVAILSGDAMMIKAYEFFFDLRPAVLSKVIKLFNTTALQVCEGQQYDMNFERKPDVGVDEYLEMIELKTSVLIAAGVKIGALIGGATEKDAANLYQYGRNIGMAFQLQDDLLDTFGATGTFGKKIGNDIVSNKKTYLLITAIGLAKGKMHTELMSLLNDNKFTAEEKIKKVTDIYRELNIEEKTGRKIDEYFVNALQFLDNLKIRDDKKDPLRQLSEMLMNRKK